MYMFGRRAIKILTGKELDVTNRIKGYDMMSDDELDVKYYIYEEDYNRLKKPMNEVENSKAQELKDAITKIDKSFFETPTRIYPYILHGLMYKEGFGYYKTFPTNENMNVTFLRLDYYGEDYETALKLLLNEYIERTAYMMKIDKEILKQEYVEKFGGLIKDAENDDVAQGVFGFPNDYRVYFAVRKIAELYNKYYNGVLPNEVVEYLNAYANFHLPQIEGHFLEFNENLELEIKREAKVKTIGTK